MGIHRVADRAGDFQIGSGYLTLVRAQAARLRGRLADAGRFASQAAAMLAPGGVCVPRRDRVYSALVEDDGLYARTVGAW